MKTISSRDNPLYKALKKLGTSARERRKTGKTLLDGIHLVAAHHQAGGLPETIVVSPAGLEDREIRDLLAEIPGVPVVMLEEGMFREVSTVETPTGIIAVVERPKPARPGSNNFCVFLEGIQDPGNLGSILRSAAAAGADGAYLSDDCVDAWSPKVLRAGMGAHFCLAILEHADLAQAAERFSGTVVATALGARESLFALDLTGPTAFIIGNEGAGITPDLLLHADRQVNIPMPGAVESLNAAAAATVCLFERVRQTSGWKGV
jgi:TrmH family RNA methyltransferase